MAALANNHREKLYNAYVSEVQQMIVEKIAFDPVDEMSFSAPRFARVEPINETLLGRLKDHFPQFRVRSSNDLMTYTVDLT